MSSPNYKSPHQVKFTWLCPQLLLIIATTSLLIATYQQQFVEATNNNNNKKDVSRKSIVFDIKTPKVFYCPQEKQSDHNKMIVKAKPLDKLCEFGGKSKPKGSPSDCYNDVDETEFACDEKKRFLLRLDAEPPTSTENPDIEEEYILHKSLTSKKKTIAEDKNKQQRIGQLLEQIP